MNPLDAKLDAMITRLDAMIAKVEWINRILWLPVIASIA
jgi:hypothetical protein